MNELERQQAGLFRRRRFEAPHRGSHPLRRLARPFTSAVAVVGIPAVLTWWVLTSSQLAIREVRAVSSGRVAQRWLEERLEPLHGRHLLALKLEDVEGCLAGHPWVDSVVVRRQLPGLLEVVVREKRPAALWNEDGELSFLDAAGRVIAPLDADFGEVDLPVVSATSAATATGIARAVEMFGAWERLRPEDKVSEIEILASGDFRLVTSTLPFAVIVSGEGLATAPAMLTRAQNLIDNRFGQVAVVDLRFSRQIVFQPAVLPPREEG